MPLSNNCYLITILRQYKFRYKFSLIKRFDYFVFLKKCEASDLFGVGVDIEYSQNLLVFNYQIL